MKFLHETFYQSNILLHEMFSSMVAIEISLSLIVHILKIMQYLTHDKINALSFIRLFYILIQTEKYTLQTNRFKLIIQFYKQKNERISMREY